MGVYSFLARRLGLDPRLTLVQALDLGGGGFRKLARLGVAGLLNSVAGGVHYPYTADWVLTGMHDAVIAGQAEPLTQQLADANNLPCPLSGEAGAGWPTGGKQAQAASANRPAFPDVAATSPFADGTFRPAPPITRGQFVKVLVRAFGNPKAPGSAGAPAHFPDVPPAPPYHAYITTAYHYGLIGGFKDGSFRPAAPVNRGQAAKILGQAAGWPVLRPAAPLFADVPAAAASHCLPGPSNWPSRKSSETGSAGPYKSK